MQDRIELDTRAMLQSDEQFPSISSQKKEPWLDKTWRPGEFDLVK